MKKKCFIIVILIFSILVSCVGGDGNVSQSTEPTTLNIDGVDREYLSFINDEPLKVLYLDESRWGVPASQKDNMIYNYISLSELCEKELGFPVKFVKLSASNQNENNVFATWINVGNEGDLIFPTQPMFYHFEPNYFYWNDRYIDEGLYMDLTPYISRFCPEVLINFDRYPFIKDMCTVNGKIYALYAGMPEISSSAVLINNQLLEEENIDIHSLNTYDAIYELMDNLHQGKSIENVSDQIVVHPSTLLKYAIRKHGYDQVWESDVLFRSDDEEYIPRLIEDTNVIDYIFEKFNKFFINSYFTTDINLDRMKAGQQAMYISSNPLLDIKTFASKYKEIFYHYSIAFLDDYKAYIDRPDRIRLTMIPSTGTQPEKALMFMQWLMTDEDAADILTFGSQVLNLKHYTFSDDSTIIPEANNTIYAFCYLVANFSKKAYLCGNKEFDIINEYREMTYDVHYPMFYKLIESQHDHYESTTVFSMEYNASCSARNRYLLQSLKEAIDNPNDAVTADNIKNKLTGLTDTRAMLEDYNAYIRSVLKSN